MRVILAAAAIICLLGIILKALEGHWGPAAGFALGFWMACGWFLAIVTANRSIDEAIREDDE